MTYIYDILLQLSSLYRHIRLCIAFITMTNEKKSYRIASIPGDGIGIEVIAAALEVLEALVSTLQTFHIQFEHLPWGSAYYKKTGKFVDDDVLSIVRKYDACLFGAVGDPGRYRLHKLALILAETLQIFPITSRFGVCYLP